MAYGYWGRVPIGNFITTKFLFSAVSARLGTQRARNRVKGLFVPSNGKVSQEACREAILKYLESGFDRFSVGGGPKNLTGFVNIDVVPHRNVQREIVADVRDLSFIPSECAAQVHTNHVLEHFPEHELIHQLTEYRRILKASGTLSLRVPNALGAAFGFWFPPVLESRKEEFIKLGFPADEDFCNPADVWTHKDVFALLHWFYGDVGNRGAEHLTLITPTSLTNYLTAAGFEVIAMTEPEALNLVAIARKPSR